MEPRILIVDDGRLARWSISVFLKQNGFDVLAAADDREALALLNENNVDLVISGDRRPQLNGLLLRDIINTKFPRTAVLVMTDPECSDKSHGDNFLLKPILLEELLAKARRMLKRKEHQ